MKTLIENLFTVLAEEGTEIAHRVCKIDRFGLDQVQPGQGLTNRQRLELEIQDLYTVASMLIAKGELDPACLSFAEAKQQKVLDHFELSKWLQTATDGNIIAICANHRFKSQGHVLTCVSLLGAECEPRWIEKMRCEICGVSGEKVMPKGFVPEGLVPIREGESGR